MLQAARLIYNLEIFTSRTDLTPDAGIVIEKMAVPMKPVFLQSILFTAASIGCNLRAGPATPRLRISTQGGFPYCDISYAHCCHKLFLTRYRAHITGGLFTRSARLINHFWSAAMERIAFRRAQVIVSPSHGLAQELASAYGSQIASKLRIIGNPVDCQSFFPRASPDRNRPFTFAFCALGNFEWKGLGLILQSLAQGVCAQLKVIGGTEAEISRYRKLAADLRIPDHVQFVGLQTDVRPHLWSSDVFILPSVYETFPLVCLQAAAAGLPIIATDLYGLENILVPGVSGWRVERTVESILSAMRAAVANPAHTADQGRQALALAKTYDVPSFQRQWLALLAELFNPIPEPAHKAG
jgi:glycosyltransferase involved in cell wall biosynthesis